jgi:D-alanine-D-alanine ligase
LGALTTGDLHALQPAWLLPDPNQPGLYGSNGGAKLRLLTELDVVFPVLHGTLGEDGSLQGLLEMSGVAYVGAGVLASSLGMDKGVFKSVMRAHDIPVVDWMVAERSEIEARSQSIIEQAMQLGPFPLFVKPANLGSSVGVTKCMSASDMLEGLYDAARFDRRILIEVGVKNAREIEVAVLGNQTIQASVAGEIRPSREFYSYEAKYIDDASELIIPARLGPAQQEVIQEMAIRAFNAIDGAGMARVDFLLEGDAPERIWLSEVNTIPGFTRNSMYPKLWEYSGLVYPALIDRLIDLAFERKAQRDGLERRYRGEMG